MCLCFILPVTALALYPFSCFQKFLGLFPFHWFMLRTFMDSFQGCYKDGTEPGTRDYRWFVVIFSITRFFLLFFIFIAYKDVFLSLSSLILILHTTLLATLQPFKSSVSHYNVINITFMLLLTLFTMSVTALQNIISDDTKLFFFFFFVLALIFGSIPSLYASAIILYWIYSHRKFGLSIMQWLKAWRHGYVQLQNETEALPDRMENSGRYPRGNLANFVSTNNLSK